MAMPCPACGCTCLEGDGAHQVVAALQDDDLDAAIDRGLLVDLACGACSDDCVTRLAQAREQRLDALAARERHRARQQRLARRARGRADARAEALRQPAALPAAAAAALARAKARAAGK